MYSDISVLELEINNIKYLDFNTYKNVTMNNGIISAVMFFAFSFILVLAGFLERNYRRKN